MKKALEYLKSCGTFYLATCEKDQPRVRPFGAVCAFEDKLYLVTNNQKEVYRQLKANGKVEISAMAGEGSWIRLEGLVEEDLRREARAAMLEQNPLLSAMYNADDNLMTVFYFVRAKASVSSFTAAPVVWEF